METLLPEARDLSWSVLDLNEVVPAKGWDLRIPFREPRVAESPTGWQLSLDELVAFGEWARQIIDGLFVACTSADAFRSGAIPMPPSSSGRTCSWRRSTAPSGS